ncbi:unnamed protein product [Paramecium pentaurelia]|uniref:Uncharacterized protein n=1 Tax=Paramecium pentaurelia TaxID=43138 RepID=A0A8S1T8Q6_9CILI|nr:unnamed protein product [Paramecium pentaurelia]
MGNINKVFIQTRRGRTNYGYQKKNKETYGFMNLPNNLKYLFLLNFSKCKIHINRRCGLLHLSAYHGINFYDILEKAIKSKVNTEIKRSLEQQIKRYQKIYNENNWGNELQQKQQQQQ